MEFPVTVESQEDFDKLVGARLTREREKFSDYDALKSQVVELTKAAQDAEAAIQAEKERADAAESWKADRESADALEADRAAVAKEYGVPVEVLRGASKDEFAAHAAALKPILTAHSGLVIPNQGDTPNTAPKDSEERAAVRSLFGGADPTD